MFSEPSFSESVQADALNETLSRHGLCAESQLVNAADVAEKIRHLENMLEDAAEALKVASSKRFAIMNEQAMMEWKGKSEAIICATEEMLECQPGERCFAANDAAEVKTVAKGNVLDASSRFAAKK